MCSEDICVIQSEADLCEFDDRGPGEGVDGDQLEQQEKESTALTKCTGIRVSLWPKQTVMGPEWDSRQAKSEVAQVETQRQSPCLCLQASVEQQYKEQNSISTYRTEAGANHQRSVNCYYPLHCAQ